MDKSIVENTQTSIIEVPIEQIKNIPALLGEDVLKAIQLPGVQSSEGSSGFYVRGGKFRSKFNFARWCSGV